MLPKMMVGQTEVRERIGANESKTYFGGFTGNEVIFNSSPDTVGEFEYSLTAKKGLANCIGADLKKVTSCFFFKLSPYSNAVKMLRSRTSINGSDAIEVAALFYGSRLISGDAYSGSNDLNNFSFWGRSLAESKGDISRSDAPWKISGYELNDNAQSSWLNSDGIESKSIQAFSSSLDRLFSNSTALSDAATAQIAKEKADMNIYLQAFGGELTSDIYQKDAPSFPEGKVWSVNKDLVIGGRKKIIYHGVGTIIVKGNIIVGEGTSFVPGDERKDHLGVIALDE